MRVRAVIFDVYKTLLEVAPVTGAERRWSSLHTTWFHKPPALSLEALRAKCERLVAVEHAEARRAGVPYPEVQWHQIMLEALPNLAALTPVEQEEFLFRHVALVHTVSLKAQTASVLRQLQRRKVRLGIASNAQAYSQRELTETLSRAGFNSALFSSGLCFWSFEHGFSKPDPHVFRVLRARLCRLGVQPGEALMVGDRRDNDIEPARRQGFQTWLLTPKRAAGANTGSWAQLGRWLDDNLH